MLIDGFPHRLLKFPAASVLEEREKLKSASSGVYPIILGPEYEARRVAQFFQMIEEDNPGQETTAALLSRAATLQHPAGLVQHKADEAAFYEELMRKNGIDPSEYYPQQIMIEQEDGSVVTLTGEDAKAYYEAHSGPPVVGDWPDAPEIMGQPYYGETPDEPVFVALIETDDWTTVPIHLRWGGWNECPPSEFHTAAFRSWRDRYGAEVVSMGGDLVIMRVKRRPQSREEALKLAQEMHIYNNDIVDQGYGTYANLAAALMESDWWGFWWD